MEQASEASCQERTHLLKQQEKKARRLLASLARLPRESRVHPRAVALEEALQKVLSHLPAWLDQIVSRQAVAALGSLSPIEEEQLFSELQIQREFVKNLTAGASVSAALEIEALLEPPLALPAPHEQETSPKAMQLEARTRVLEQIREEHLRLESEVQAVEETGDG